MTARPLGAKATAETAELCSEKVTVAKPESELQI